MLKKTQLFGTSLVRGPRSGALAVIDDATASMEIGTGYVFTDAVTKNTGQARVLHIATPAGLNPIMRLRVYASASTTIAFASCTTSNAGSAITTAHFNRYLPTRLSTSMLFYHTPTSTPVNTILQGIISSGVPFLPPAIVLDESASYTITLTAAGDGTLITTYFEWDEPVAADYANSSASSISSESAASKSSESSSFSTPSVSSQSTGTSASSLSPESASSLSTRSSASSVHSPSSASASSASKSSVSDQSTASSASASSASASSATQSSGSQSSPSSVTASVSSASTPSSWSQSTPSASSQSSPSTPSSPSQSSGDSNSQ